MLNDKQFHRLIASLIALETLLDNRLARAMYFDPDGEESRRLFNQRFEIRQFSTWVGRLLSDALSSDADVHLPSLMRPCREFALASECWEIFAEHMPYTAYDIAGDCGCDERDGVSAWQLMLPL